MSNSDITILLNRLAGVYRDPSRISRDASALLRCPLGQNLRPSISMLALNDGAYHPSVLVFQGTIAMTYRNNQYNIPVDIYLPPQYPVRPPVCFVRPVENMVIKENHRHVGSDGMIYMPYLHTWNQSNHSLTDMASSMSLIFGADPPVFSRRNNHSSNHSNNSNNARPQPPPPYKEVNYQDAEAIAMAESKRLEMERLQRLKEEEEMAVKLSIQEENERRERVRLEKLREEEELRRKEEQRLAKEKLKKDLTEKFQDHLSVFFQESRNRLTSDLKDQTALSNAEKKTTSQMNNLQQLKTELTSHCQHVDEQTELLQAKLQTTPSAPAEEPNVDDLVQPADLHSEQLLNLSAENAAISDCLYFLDKALSKGNIPLDVHLKKTRELAKRQFFVRAHGLKIAHFVSKDSEEFHGSHGASMISL